MFALGKKHFLSKKQKHFFQCSNNFCAVFNKFSKNVSKLSKVHVFENVHRYQITKQKLLHQQKRILKEYFFSLTKEY